MKQFAAIVLTALFLSGPAIAAAGELQPYEERSEPPALALPDLGGRRHTLDSYRGQVVLVNFWASWCTPCLMEMPSMQRLVEAMAGRPFQILAVNTEETKSKVWKFKKLLNISFPTLLDSSGDATRAWAVDVFPTSYLIDAGGRIQYVSYGALEWDDAAVVTVIETLMPDQSAGTTAAAQRVPR